MTTTPDKAPPPPSAHAEVRIHNFLSRGYGPDAQVLLVLVSTPAGTRPDEEVWVGIHLDAPVAIPTDQSWDSIEAARPIRMAELKALDLQRKAPKRPFGLDAKSGRRYWLARFDMSDHQILQENWRWLIHVQGSEPTKSLDVVAWRSRVVSTRDANNAVKCVFEPVPGDARARMFLSDVVVQPLFELGVLFVHGIGDHGVRETLVRWAEPIVKFWRDRGLELTAQAQAVVPEDERHRVHRWIVGRQLRNRMPLDGITRVVSSFATTSNATLQAKGREPLVPPIATRQVPCIAVIRAEQTKFANPDSGQPSSTLLRLSNVDANAVLRESHVLFAEAYWTREAFPPTFTELYEWLTIAVPIAVWSRLRRLVSTRPHELFELYRASTGAFDRFRFVVSMLVWVLQVAVMPALYVVAALASQIGIGLIALVGVIPIAWLRAVTRAVMGALIGTLGQSFALQTSIIRRSAIVSGDRNNLDWLSDHCHRVVVVSHSQGAEISRRVFLGGRRSKLARWYTAGAGIAPLDMLDQRSLQHPVSQRVVRTSRLALVISVLVIAGFALDAIPGSSFGAMEFMLYWMRGIGWQGFAGAYLLLLSTAIYFGSRDGPVVRPQLRKSTLNKWRDFYASQDPVPGGSLVDRFEPELRQMGLPVPAQKRIFNTRFTFFDHTSYFRNIEEFVAPIALDLLRLAGMGCNQHLEEPILKRAARRRDERTWWNMVITVLGLLACVASAAWIAFGPSQRGEFRREQVQSMSANATGIGDQVALLWHGGFLGGVIIDLFAPLVILILLTGWWVCYWYLGQRSVKTMVRELASAART